MNLIPTGVKFMLYLKENNKCLRFGDQYLLWIPQQGKTYFYLFMFNQYQFSPFSAHNDILAPTETHKHTAPTLHFYSVCASNVLIYDMDKFLLCIGKIHFLKLVVLISRQLTWKYSPGMELLPSSFPSLFLNQLLAQRVEILFLDSSAWWWTSPFYTFSWLLNQKNHINSKLSWISPHYYHTAGQVVHLKLHRYVVGFLILDLCG